MTKVIMTNSFRGGTGKTTILSNLSSYLASFGLKVIIIDADIISPGVHAMFGLNQKAFLKTMTDYMRGGAKITDCVYDISKNVDISDGNLFLVPSSIAKEDIADLLIQKNSSDLIIKAIEKLKKDLEPDFIMIDTHPGLNKEVLAAFNAIDILINVARPDNQDYQGLEVTSSIAKKLKIKSYVILNKVHRKNRKISLVRDVEEAFKIPVAGMLPLSEDLILAQSQYVFSERYPDHPFSKEIQNIARRMFDVKPRKHLELMHYLLKDIKKKGPISVEEIVSEKNVYQPRSKRYINDLLKADSITKVKDKDGKDMLSITKKGEKFLDKYDVISKFVDGFRL